jgi:AraC-like DNA-binding protein
MDELEIPLLDMVSLPGYHALFTLEPIFRQRDSFESRLRLTPEQLQNIADLVRRLELESQSESPGRKFASLAYFMLIVADLCRYYSHTVDPAAQQLLRLGRVIGYMQEHWADQFTLDDLARIGYMSRRTLTREFGRVMGCSPIEYLIRLRINRAVDLLRRSNARITDIAFQTGFQDSNYFARQFRATIGCSPREFRSRWQFSSDPRG